MAQLRRVQRGVDCDGSIDFDESLPWERGLMVVEASESISSPGIGEIGFDSLEPRPRVCCL